MKNLFGSVTPPPLWPPREEVDTPESEAMAVKGQHSRADEKHRLPKDAQLLKEANDWWVCFLIRFSPVIAGAL
jgi:hypothetical protein